MQHFADVPPLVVENLLSAVIFPVMFVSFLSGIACGFLTGWWVSRIVQ